MTHPENTFAARLAVRHRIGQLFHIVCLLATWVGLVILLILLAGVLWKGVRDAKLAFSHALRFRTDSPNPQASRRDSGAASG